MCITIDRCDFAVAIANCYREVPLLIDLAVDTAIDILTLFVLLLVALRLSLFSFFYGFRCVSKLQEQSVAIAGAVDVAIASFSCHYYR